MRFKNIHHIGVAVSSITEAEAFHVETLGMKRLSELVHDPVQKVNVLLLGYSDSTDPRPLIELIEPAGQPSPVDRFIQGKASLYHYCLEVDQIDEAIQALRKQGLIIIQKPVEAVLFKGRKIAWLIAPAGHLIELLESETC